MTPATGAYQAVRQHLPVGTILRGDDGPAVVLGPDHDALDGLAMLLEHDYGGTWTRDDPALVEVASTLSVSVWRSCTKAWREANCWDEYADSWWAQDGDGAREIRVVWWSGFGGEDIYSLGDRLTSSSDSGVLS